MNPVLKGYLRLCRPPNLPTAAADILAGMAIAGFFLENQNWISAVLLIISSIFMYAGGVVFNDYFDYELDTIERPERPLPSGLIQPAKARNFGMFLFVLGVLCAASVSLLSGLIAVILALAILVYDSKSKHHPFFGPLNMGLCRGLNLLLGMSIFQTFDRWMYLIIPILFIFAVTLISRGEVHGNNKKNILLAGILYVLVTLFVILLHQVYQVEEYMYLIFLGLFLVLVIDPLLKAYKENVPKNIMNAVKAGVLSIVILDAALATAHSNWQVGVCILLLLPLSMALAKLFAVT